MEVWRMIRNMKDRGMSNREIASELGISRNTVRKIDVLPLSFGQL